MRVPLFDEAKISFAGEDSVSYSDGSSFKRDNVLRALDAVRRIAGSDKRFSVAVKRRIPSGQGLGASSAAAAAAASGAAKLLGVDAAAALKESGADCAFQASSYRAALARGLGEELTKVDLPPLYVLFCTTGRKLESEKVFAAYDVVGGAGGDYMDFITEQRPFNALETAAAAIEPDILRARRALTAAGFERVAMTGSGAGYIAVTSDKDEYLSGRGKLKAIALKESLITFDFTEVSK